MTVFIRPFKTTLNFTSERARRFNLRSRSETVYVLVCNEFHIYIAYPMVENNRVQCYFAHER